MNKNKFWSEKELKGILSGELKNDPVFINKICLFESSSSVPETYTEGKLREILFLWLTCTIYLNALCLYICRTNLKLFSCSVRNPRNFVLETIESFNIQGLFNDQNGDKFSKKFGFQNFATQWSKTKLY